MRAYVCDCVCVRERERERESERERERKSMYSCVFVHTLDSIYHTILVAKYSF